MSRANFGSIRKLPSGRFQARYILKGTQVNAPTTFPTKTMARQWLNDENYRIRHALSLGEYESIKPAKPKLLTCDKYFLQWKEDLYARDLSPDTIRAYASKWRAHLAEHFGNLRPDEITRATILDWDANKDWSSSILRTNTFRTLSAFFNFLVDRELIEETPLKRIKYTARETKKKERRIATPEQLENIQEFMPPQLRIAVDLGAWCTLRFGEVAGLERRDIDLESGTISVLRATHRGEGGVESVGRLKTRASERIVNMPPAVWVRMKDHMERFVSKEPDALVVYTLGDPSKRLSNKHLHKYYDPAVDAAGLPGYRFHDLRHTALTMAARAGATLEELKARAGHSSNDVAMLYQTATLERDRELAQRLGG